MDSKPVNAVMHFIAFMMVLGLLLIQCVSAQTVDNNQGDVLDTMLYDSSMGTLENAVKETSRRHAVYSYNLSNATTPGFRPILFAEDQAEIYELAPPGVANTYFNKVLLEHQTAKLARNRSRQSAYYALYRKKLDNYRQILSLGKK